MQINEVIIVDGHSTDDTVEIAKEYGCKSVYEKLIRTGLTIAHQK
ncbi:MAG: glycosyltransferase [Halobacteriota archaeon]